MKKLVLFLLLLYFALILSEKRHLEESRHETLNTDEAVEDFDNNEDDDAIEEYTAQTGFIKPKPDLFHRSLGNDIINPNKKYEKTGPWAKTLTFEISGTNWGIITALFIIVM